MSKLRLLICHTHQSVQPLPWCGEDNQCAHPACTEPLEYRLTGHIGCRVDLGDIEEKHWDNAAMRPSIIKQAIGYTLGPGKAAGLGEQYYDVRSTFRDDAMECWRRHNRTKDCDEFRADRMRLYPDTRADRKEIGLDPKLRPSTFLCDFCPVLSIKMQRMRKDKYGYTYTE